MQGLSAALITSSHPYSIAKLHLILFYLMFRFIGSEEKSPEYVQASFI